MNAAWASAQASAPGRTVAKLREKGHGAIVSVSSGRLSEPLTRGYGIAGDDGHGTVVDTSRMAVSQYHSGYTG